MGAAVVMLASSAVEAGGGIAGGIGANKAAKKQAAIYDDEANAVLRQGAFEEAQAARSYDRLLGEQKLNIAASGRELEGSPLLILDQTIRDKEEEIANIRYNTGRARDRQRSAAKQSKQAGRAALTSSIIGAFGTAGKAYGQYSAAKNPSKQALSTGGTA